MIKCPVCGEYEFAADNDFDVCDTCGWENDGVQMDDPEYHGGANWVSLNQARENYKKLGKAMSPEDKEAAAAFYAKHVGPDGKWIS